MSNVEIVAKDIRNIVRNRADNRNQILIEALGNIKTCNGKHAECCKKVRNNMHWYKRLPYTNIALTMVFGLVIIGMCFFRSFNRANRYGGCAKNLFWPFDECSTAF